MVKCVLIYSHPPPPLTVSSFPLFTDKKKLKIDFKIVTAVIINRIIEFFSVLWKSLNTQNSSLQLIIIPTHNSVEKAKKLIYFSKNHSKQKK